MPKGKVPTREEILSKMYRHNDYRHEMQIRIAQPGEGEQETDAMIIEGRAVTFDEETVLFEYDGIEYKEIIAKGAFDNTDMSYAFMKYNHSDTIMAMARTKNNTLQIDVRDDGVYVKAELADTTAGRDLYTLVKRGDIDKMSFSFTIEEESYNKESRTWTVRKIDKLYDVAAVTVPAYENTDLYARRYGEVETSRSQEVEAEALERSRTVTRIRLNMAHQTKTFLKEEK
jgi:HK97 family phage prohead protease